MKCAGLQWIVQRNRDHVSGGALVPHSDVASFLADDDVSELFQRTDETVG